MPSRMLVAETARMAAAGAPAAAIASAMHARTSCQFPAVSNTCEPGTPGSGTWVYSRWPIATWLPSTSKSTARTDPVPASIVSRDQSSAADRVVGSGGGASSLDDALTCTSTRIRSVRSHDR